MSVGDNVVLLASDLPLAMDQLAVDADNLLDCLAEERAEPEGKALNLLVNLCSNSHLWS